MAITSLKTRSRTFSTYRMDETKLNNMVLRIEEYKPDEVMEDTLSRPFDQIKANFLQIYKHLYNRGINV